MSSGWQNLNTQNIVTLTDGATVAIDASQGYIFELITVQNPTILTPTNPPGVNKSKFIEIRIKAQSSARTPSFTTGATDSFSLGTALSSVNAIVAGTYDIYGFDYMYTLRRWLWVAWMPGFS